MIKEQKEIEHTTCHYSGLVHVSRYASKKVNEVESGREGDTNTETKTGSEAIMVNAVG